MKTWKRIALAVGALLVVIVAALAAAPLLFQDRIEARVKSAIHQRLDTRVDFGRVGLNLFRHFPNLAFSLDDLTVTGTDAFDGDTLAHVGRFRLVVDLGSAVGALRRGDALVVRSIAVDRPYLNARVLPDGRASWDIVRPAPDPLTPEDAAAEDDAAGQGDGERAGAGVTVALRRFDITDARITLDDAAAGLHATIQDLDHTLAGDFGAGRFTLRTSTTARGVSVRQAGIPYLTDARLQADADLDADFTDPAARRFTFRENRVALNELGLGLDGSATLLEDGADVDVTFAADRVDFRHILSLLPPLYTEDFASLEASGTVAVSGHARGRHGPASVPAFGLDLEVDDGEFHYADLPLPVRGVFVDLAVTNPGGDADATVVELSRFDLSLGDEPFSATMRLATPVSDPDLALSLAGRVDLGALRRAVPMDGIDELAGTITTDAAIRTRMSWIREQRYDRVEARGRLGLRDVAARGEALPHPVAVDEMSLELTPAYADLSSFRARAGSSDVQARGRLENLLGFALLRDDLRGSAAIESRFIDLDEWRTEPDTTRELGVIPVPPRLDLALTAAVDSMKFDRLAIADARGALQVRDQRVTLDRFALRTLGGDIVMSGWYETVDPERPAFDFDLAMSGLDIPGAFATFNTVQALAPAARYATGRFSADMGLTGVLGADMAPDFDVLDGQGGIRTRGISIQGMPALHRLAEAVRIDRLRDPAVSDIAASLTIRDGRLQVHPFEARIAGAQATIGGSNGIDRSLDYRVALELPRSELGADANRVISGLLAESGRVGIDLDDADAVRLDAAIGGTMAEPTVRVDFGDALATAGTAARGQVEARLEDARRQVEQARLQAEAEARARAERAEAEARERARRAEEEARAEARARADSIIADAETRADQLRAEAARLARSVRQEADQQADRLLAEAGNPVSRRAAQIAGDRLRAQADQRATDITTEADRRAEQLLAEARRQADAALGDSGP